MAGQLRYYTWIVTGQGRFPFEMLPYDNCWPRDEGAPLGGNTLAEHRTIRMAGIKPPAQGRWRSFGWEVSELERPYMSYPLVKDMAYQNQQLREENEELKKGAKKLAQFVKDSFPIIKKMTNENRQLWKRNEEIKNALSKLVRIVRNAYIKMAPSFPPEDVKRLDEVFQNEQMMSVYQIDINE